ncbi:class I SAM-dependent methyltransferase [Jiella sp. MQZ9-1]|uniref:Class I SAM-dependent methyltransferase n=1 Tax=Jiella flava TaxID=2816857 RepID=A0A939JXA8_9HYPH|nr:class I SAM-dependent methyltransferase [Jiella flava]MBO0663877.1 class I SAM-dependent methyltransferase [Jiella flava]MCD2472449.1 class I SAM-dependent methyltransferase [Jiella flava]
MSTNADIIDLCDFYASPLGITAARSISLALSPLWRPISEERLLGLGYATPYLSRFEGGCERCLAFMPAGQGAERWPAGQPLRTALVGIEEMPLGDSSVDRILMIHALEFAENPEALIAEAWRVLAPGGSLIVVVPHRRGVWARFEHTPFGSGRPWSRSQLTGLLRSATFTPHAWGEALLFPPFRRRSLLGFASALERVGRKFWPIFAGVVIIEAVKQLHRGIPVTSAAKQRKVAKPVLVPAGAGAGARAMLCKRET